MSYSELIDRLGSVQKDERRLAVEALRSELPAARGEVLTALRAPDWRTRAGAAAVLDHAEQDRDVESALVAAAADVDARVRRSAFHSLACEHCKPDGCVAPTSLDLMVEGMLHDGSIRLRRNLAGEMMWGQHGRSELVVAAFRHLLNTEVDRTLRERAATFLASCELPRESMPYREWIGAWKRRIAELLSSDGAPLRNASTA